ncbi:hypothetical protein M0805_000086 [Coniferiporia weirii]|nr:hypothetical protein M0805_000086 [Coniferiporia weirii]
MSSAVARAKRRAEADEAYAIQARAGAWGALKYGLFGAGVMTLSHYTWPAFRKQTLAIKGFLTMGFVCFGLVTHADSALLAHEHGQRVTETRVRKEARIDLAKRGLVATETEIAKWKEERAARLQAEREFDPSASQSR